MDGRCDSELLILRSPTKSRDVLLDIGVSLCIRSNHANEGTRMGWPRASQTRQMWITRIHILAKGFTRRLGASIRRRGPIARPLRIPSSTATLRQQMP